MEEGFYLKLLVIAADALIPDYIFGQKELFPNISKLIDNGASSEYSAYVQRNYNGSYSSSQNWSSIYTGLSPQEHNIDIKKTDGEYIHPSMCEFDDFQPLWRMLNDNDYSLGLFQPSCCNNPVSINGYCVTSMYSPIFKPTENREAKRHIQLCENDAWISNLLKDEPPPRVYPKTLKQLGYTFAQLKDNPDLADEMYKKYDFAEIIKNFDDELNYWKATIKSAYAANPVDAVWFYTPSTDIIPHFVLHEDNSPVLIACYKALDNFIGELIDEFSPENIVIMSDHGQANFNEIVKCSDSNIQREAFSKSDEALWLNNGYIAFEAQNGGLLLTTHSLKGVFIACGKHIKHTVIEDMRTLDIYPTLLEMLEIKILNSRSGFVADIFDRPFTNPGNIIPSLLHKKIAYIQSHEISVTDIFLNQIYIDNRFSDITIVGEEKYREIFLNNPRVTDFVPFEKYNIADFDEVYCGFHNQASKEMNHLRIY